MSYKVNIIPGHRADCPDGYSLQRETGNIVSEIEGLSKLFGLSGPDITLEFSPNIKRGAAAQPRPKDRNRDQDFPLDGYDCPHETWRDNEFPIDRPHRYYPNDNYPLDWREKNRENLFDLLNEFENNDVHLECYNDFASIVRQREGNVNIDDIKRYIMFSNSEVKGKNWANWIRSEITNTFESQEKQEIILDNMQTTFGFLAATTAMTLGSYCHATRTITIYDVAIKSMYPHCYREAMLATYVHELFHAVHHDAIWNNHSSRDEELIVLESLASFFEYRFCMEQARKGISPKYNNYLANDLYNEWDMYDVIEWPYSGAIAMVDLDYIPAGNDYLFSRTYRKSTRDLFMSYCNIISAYETHEGKTEIGKGAGGTRAGVRTWPVGEYFREKKNPFLENLYNDLFAELQRYAPSVFADAIYSLGYIRIRDDSVDTKKKRSRAIAVIKFEKKTNTLNIETNMPISFTSGFSFVPKTSNANFPYGINIGASYEIAEAAKVLKDSLDQMK